MCRRAHPRQIVVMIVNLRKLFKEYDEIEYMRNRLKCYFYLIINIKNKLYFKIICKNGVMIHTYSLILSKYGKKRQQLGMKSYFLLFMVMKILYSRNLSNDERFYVIYELFWKINLDYFYSNLFSKKDRCNFDVFMTMENNFYND